ncbi:hypothetical protein NPJJOOEL_00019 [Enterobacteria phage Brandy]|nr:hypothetical protein NPJJOOEL_00019 [Enterobacteria phage Brandy]
MKNMIAPEDVAFKTAFNGDILIFIDGKHAGMIEPDGRWGVAELYNVAGVEGHKTALVFLSDKDQMRRKVSALYNEAVYFYEPFNRIKTISRVTRKDVNACVIKIVENQDKLTKDQIVDLLKEIIL